MLGRFFGFCIFPGKCVSIRAVRIRTDIGQKMGTIFTLQTPIWRIVSLPPPLLPFFSLPDPAGSTAVIIHPSIPIRTCPSLFSFLFLFELFPLSTDELLMFKSNLFIDLIGWPAGPVPSWFIPFHLFHAKEKNEIEEQSSNNFLFSLELRLSSLDSLLSINSQLGSFSLLLLLSLSSPFVCSHDQSPCADNTQTTHTHTHREREEKRRERENQESGPASSASQPIVSPAPSAEISFLSYYRAIYYTV